MEDMQGKDDHADARLPAQWYCEAACARLKGISKAWLNEHPWAKPLGGKGRSRIAGRWRWPREVVEAWLGQDDIQLWKLYGAAARRWAK